MVSIISVIILLGILIFVHEFGHFITAKFLGVGVLKFSLGFGPKLIGKKIGETEYMISLIPLGGYVKLFGETEDEMISEDDQKKSFLSQNVWKKMAIVAAGPLFNFIFAIIVFTFVYVWGFPVLTSMIGLVQENSPALYSGLKKDDLIVAINDEKISRWNDLAEHINESKGAILNLTVRRNSEVLSIQVQPKSYTAKNIFGEEVDSYKIGISPSGQTIIERFNIFTAFAEAIKQTWVITKLTLLSIIKMIEGVLSPRTLGGPIMIAQMAGAQVKEGFIPYILFMALLSINLAVLNLLPIPILDGGHIFFYIIELISGKEINIKWRERAQQVGFALLILLMVFVLIMDLQRLNMAFIKDIFKFFSGAN